MAEVVYKKRRTTEEERKKRRDENTRWQNKRYKASYKNSIALKKKKIPYTAEEKAEVAKEKRDAVEEKARELKKARPPRTPRTLLKMIDNIGKQKVSDDLGFPISYIVSWNTYHIKGDVKNGWSIRGKLMKELQEYFAKH